ncbi:hypothetical protein BOO71_0008707 [Deinococcus marmoris]|uniref:Uncharacterized protein n=1 Tax=Deinococcus marmoris TaxID=249408 RepID=A0A1U7NX40_9DEIO|nr:hypothetical protein BOO71_0008707 [Deinococcus marmoris]
MQQQTQRSGKLNRVQVGQGLPGGTANACTACGTNARVSQSTPRPEPDGHRLCPSHHCRPSRHASL